MPKSICGTQRKISFQSKNKDIPVFFFLVVQVPIEMLYLFLAQPSGYIL